MPDPSLLAPAEYFLDHAPISLVHSYTGCNRVWVASVSVMKGALLGNASLISEAYAAIHSTLIVQQQHDDGIMVDGSFHQHGPQLYTGWGYGAIFTSNVLFLELVASNTSYAMRDALNTVFMSLVLEGQQLATRGANFDFEASGRLATYFRVVTPQGLTMGHYHRPAAFTPLTLAFPTYPPPFTTPLAVVFAPLLPAYAALGKPRANEVQQYYDRMWGQASAPPLALHRHYYTSDYTVLHRESMFVSVRAFSNRTYNTEW